MEKRISFSKIKPLILLIDANGWDKTEVLIDISKRTPVKLGSL